MVLTDIFRRADKDDNGRLSVQEFENYFGDDYLSHDEMPELYKQIDADHSGFLDIDEVISTYPGF